MIGKAAILSLLGIMSPQRSRDERVHDARNEIAKAFATHHFGIKSARQTTENISKSLDTEQQEAGLRRDGDHLRNTMRELLERNG